MKLPAIIVNFKLYQQAVGAKALELAKIHDRVAKETGASIGIAVNAIDLVNVVGFVDLPVFAQHVDCAGYGSSTGKVIPEMVKQLGCYGTLLNHAEYPIDNEQIAKTLEKCKELGLCVVACAESSERAAEINEFDPDFIAVEPPELIGGDVSVSTASPNVVEESARIVGSGKLLVGAGVKTGADVRLSLKLGACGVLLASGVTKAEDPYAVLMDLVSGLA